MSCKIVNYGNIEILELTNVLTEVQHMKGQAKLLLNALDGDSQFSGIVDGCDNIMQLISLSLDEMKHEMSHYGFLKNSYDEAACTAHQMLDKENGNSDENLMSTCTPAVASELSLADTKLIKASASPVIPSMADFGITEATLSRLAVFKETRMDLGDAVVSHMPLIQNLSKSSNQHDLVHHGEPLIMHSFAEDVPETNVKAVVCDIEHDHTVCLTGNSSSMGECSRSHDELLVVKENTGSDYPPSAPVLSSLAQQWLYGH